MENGGWAGSISHQEKEAPPVMHAGKGWNIRCKVYAGK